LLQASTDQSAVDMSISNLAWAFTYRVVQLFGNIAVMSQAAWQVIIVLIPVMAASIWYQVLSLCHIKCRLRLQALLNKINECTFVNIAVNGVVCGKSNTCFVGNLK
jgi:hypothetical protein